MNYNIISVNNNEVKSQDFDFKDQKLILKETIPSNFDPLKDKVEIYIYDYSGNLLYADYNFKSWDLLPESLSPTNKVDIIELKVEEILPSLGFNEGRYKIIFNFVSNELNTSKDNPIYITEISSDRTELKLKSSDYQLLSSSLEEYKTKSIEYFDELYLNLSNNNYWIVINGITNDEDETIIVKLYEPLSLEYDVDYALFICGKQAESIAYEIEFFPEETTGGIKLKGPNFSYTNNNITSIYKNKTDIISTPLTGSYYKLQNILENSRINIKPDYSDFSNFVKFSSAKQRIINFYNKAALLEGYYNELNTLNLITSSANITSSLDIINTKISTIIKEFDGYDNYLYYESSSFSWPKQTSIPPYQLYSTGSAQVINWMGSTNDLSLYYGGMLLSSSLYDDNNQDNLLYVIPEYLREDINNNQYVLFSNLIGQFYDEIWLYVKNITNLYSQDNRLDYGVPKELVSDLLISIGFPLYSNNDDGDIFSSYLGFDTSGSLFNSGSDVINNIIDVNNSSNYTNNNIEQELNKRIFHNINSLLKKRGTINGLRELINIYGIPSSILRISEFGKRTIEHEYDYNVNVFNYALTISDDTVSGVRIPFVLTGSISPSSVLLRFKTPTFFENADYLTRASQSLYFAGLHGGGEPSNKAFGLVIEYPQAYTSESYSGSILNPTYEWGNVKLLVSGSSGYLSASVNLPIFNGEWWSTMVSRTSSGFSLTVQSKSNDRYRNYINYEGSASIITDQSASWVTPYSPTILRVGKAFSTYSDFSGSLQEIRYYSASLDRTSFDNYTLNPLSIEGNLSMSSYDILGFRGSLGSDLIVGNLLYSNSLNYDSGCFDLKSIHPSITGSTIINPWPSGGLVSSPSRYLLPETSSFNTLWYFNDNNEYISIKEPIVGTKNRLTDKIQIDDDLLVTGSTLSIQRSLLINNDIVKKDANILEIAFSPQNEVNDDIAFQLGNLDLNDVIGDPSNFTSSLTYYDTLETVKNDYFKKYIKEYNSGDYFRLIKYYNNSIFKIVHHLVPANTSLISGLVIKSHFLERNKTKNIVPEASEIILTSSIDIVTLSGSYGGMVNDLNVTQSWIGNNVTTLGNIPYSQSTNEEFVNGEFSGSVAIVTTQSLNNCPYKKTPIDENFYSVYLFSSSDYFESTFFNASTAPASGQIYLFYGSGLSEFNFIV